MQRTKRGIYAPDRDRVPVTWSLIGVAYENPDGSINLEFDALPPRGACIVQSRSDAQAAEAAGQLPLFQYKEVIS